MIEKVGLVNIDHKWVRRRVKEVKIIILYIYILDLTKYYIWYDSNYNSKKLNWQSYQNRKKKKMIFIIKKITATRSLFPWYSLDIILAWLPRFCNPHMEVSVLRVTYKNNAVTPTKRDDKKNTRVLSIPQRDKDH